MEAQQISSVCMENICAISVIRFIISAWLQSLASEILVSTSIIIFSAIRSESCMNLLHAFLEILLGKIYYLTSRFVAG